MVHRSKNIYSGVIEKGLNFHRMSSCSGGDGRGGSILTPQAENKKYQSVGTRSIIGLLDEEDVVVSRENVCSLCNVRRAAITSSVQIIRCCCLLYILDNVITNNTSRRTTSACRLIA